MRLISAGGSSCAAAQAAQVAQAARRLRWRGRQTSNQAPLHQESSGGYTRGGRGSRSEGTNTSGHVGGAHSRRPHDIGSGGCTGASPRHPEMAQPSDPGYQHAKNGTYFRRGRLWKHTSEGCPGEQPNTHQPMSSRRRYLRLS